MGTWTLFEQLYTGLITPLMAQLQGMIGNVCSTMQPIGLAMVTVWLAFVGIDIAIGHKTLPAACKDFAVAACVIVLLEAGQYTQYISDLFLTAVPNTVGAALGGMTSPAAGLDKVLNLAWTEAAATYKGLSDWSFKTVGLSIAVMAVLVVSVVAVTYAFLIYMVAAILNVASVVVGPVFLALAVIPATRRFTAGWFSVLVGGCATQLMALGDHSADEWRRAHHDAYAVRAGCRFEQQFRHPRSVGAGRRPARARRRGYGKDPGGFAGGSPWRLSRLGGHQCHDIRSGASGYARRAPAGPRAARGPCVRCDLARGRFARRSRRRALAANARRSAARSAEEIVE